MTENQQQKNLSYYCDLLASLNVSSTKKRGNAQYKPILLLSVIDLISQKIITENKILVSEELIDTFNKYWNILASEYKGGFHYPFFHLQSEGFWHLTLKPDFNGLQPKTMNKLKQSVEYASLDEELFTLIQDPESRKELIDTLIEILFSSAQKELQEILEINQSFEKAGTEKFQEKKTSRKFYMKKSLVRDSFFRKAVIHAYDYRCSLCNLKVIKSLSQSIVDGAHIKPFAQFYDNNINNGISLCKNHHWAFDRGIFSIDDNYQVLISDNFSEESPNSKPIREFQGETILLPNSPTYFPSIEAIQWHRQNIFRQ